MHIFGGILLLVLSFVIGYIGWHPLISAVLSNTDVTITQLVVSVALIIMSILTARVAGQLIFDY